MEAAMRVLVTGAASGIGRATCRRLARDARDRGQVGKVAAVDIGPVAALEELARELQPYDVEVLSLQADLATADGPAQVVAAAVERFGGLDGRVSNAGVN